ncbi:MAG: hypothetical protein KatS3mg104_3231 [Phycisphaerae bacterium]|nr:MAG: hypothetical protein KatS3mg104_3231 [Phycisphaerae bacterium]
MAVFERQRRCMRGQSIMEYSLLIGLVVAAFTVMSTFLKRSTQGHGQVQRRYGGQSNRG